jgi:hypothetical protein
MNEIKQAKYILGHSQQEIGRLMLQANILKPFTERLMKDAEIGPQLVEMGIAAEQVFPAESLATRVRSAVVEARSQIECPAQVCAWARI